MSTDALNPNQFKAQALDAIQTARRFRAFGFLNAADAKVREAAVYRQKAQYGTYPNGTAMAPYGQRATNWRHGDIKDSRVLP